VSAEPDSPTFNPPAEHARQAEEGEAESPAASPRRRQWGLHTDPEFQELAAIAHRRGLCLSDFAKVIGKPEPTVVWNCGKLGLVFGSGRMPLADPLTKEQLCALRNPNLPLPELRHDRSQRLRLPRKAELERNRRAAKRAAKAAQSRFCDAEPTIARRATVQAPSREPASPAPQQTRAHPLLQEEPEPAFDREAYERRGARQRAAARKRVEAQALALLDGDDSRRSEGGAISSNVRAVMNQIEDRRAAMARQTDPVEQAKLVLQRARIAPVCSMAVYDGDPALFRVGHRKNVTKQELLELAERHAA
jgi:hypothetical protein